MQYSIPYMTMIQPIITEQSVTVGKQIDDVGVLVSDDISEERFTALLELLRNGFGRLPAQHKNKLRIYHSDNGKTWKRI
jgi:hypothetical protein